MPARDSSEQDHLSPEAFGRNVRCSVSLLRLEAFFFSLRRRRRELENENAQIRFDVFLRGVLPRGLTHIDLLFNEGLQMGIVSLMSGQLRPNAFSVKI